MRMMNRAIEDAADFTAFREALMRPHPNVPTTQGVDGETRRQRRTRERSERKAALKAQSKVRA